MQKDVLFDIEASKAIAAGVNKVAEAVGKTLGPRGRHVLIQRQYQDPLATNDGVTVALSIDLPSAPENIGAKMVKEAASKANDSFGDGTTTATLLTQRMINDALRLTGNNVNPLRLKKGMDAALVGIIDILRGNAEPCETDEAIKNVAYVSSHQDTLVTQVVIEAIKEMGTRGVIQVQPSDDGDTKLIVTEGCMIDKGYCHSAFLRSGETEIVLDDPVILIMDKKFSNVQDLIMLAQPEVIGAKNFLVIAEDIEGDVLSSLLVTNARGSIKACAVKAPAFGEARLGILGDLAILTGTEVVSSISGVSIKGIAETMAGITKDGPVLGGAEKVIIDRDSTTIVGGYGKKKRVKARIDQLRKEADAQRSSNRYGADQLVKRAAYLEKGVAVIHVGGATQSEMEERKMRVDDALGATRAAAEGGTVVGGGVALVKAAAIWEKTINAIPDTSEDVMLGHRLVIAACEAPMWQIATNAGESGDYVVRKAKASQTDNFGFDASDLSFKNLREAGIIDPLLVVSSALRYAVSAAGMTITVGCVVTESEDDGQAS